MFQNKFTSSKPASSKSTKVFKLLSATGAILLSLLAGLLVPALLKLETAYDIEQFFPSTDPSYRNAQKVREKYHLSENPAVVFLIELPEPATWTQEEKAKRLSDVTRELKSWENVESSLSFATRAGAEMSSSAIQVGTLTEMVPSSHWPQRFREDPLMTPLLLSPDQRTALVVLEMKTTDVVAMKKLFSAAKDQLQKTFPEAQVQIGGIPALQAGFQTLLESEVFRFVSLGFLATFVLIFALFRGLSPVFVSFVSVVLSNIFVLGGMSALGYSMTVLSVTVPILVTVTVLAQIIHTFFRLHEQRLDQSLRKHWLVQKGLLLPNFFANFTTAIGFMTLAPSEIPMIANYGLVVAAAIMISWISASLSLPLLTILFPAPVPRKWSMMKSRWVLILLKHKREWSLAGIALTLITGLGAFALNWENRLFDDLPAQHESRQSTERLDHDFGGVIPLNVELRASSSDDWKQKAQLENLDQLIGQLRKVPEVGQALSLVDFLKAFDAQSRFPENPQAVSELLFLYSLSPESPIKNFLSPDGRDLRIQIRLRDIPGPQMRKVVRDIQARFQSAFPHLTVEVSGMANHLHPINDRVSRELIFGFWQAMLGIFLVLIPAFQSLRWALVACLPNLVPPALLLGALAVLQTPIKPPLALIFSISLGLAFNNTIYVFSRLMDLKAKGRRVRLIEHVFHREGMNCLHSTLVVLVGFAVFLFAQFSVNQSFGAFMLLSLFAGLFGDLVFLPALLAWKPGLLGLENKSTPSIPILATTPLASIAPEIEPAPLDENQRSSSMLSKAASFFLFASLIAMSPRVHAGPHEATGENLEARFQKALKQFQAKDEEAQVKLTIIEADGSQLVREVQLQRAGAASEQRLLARIMAPSDLKGMGLLSIVTKDNENQWVYLPSSKQVRKIVGAESSDSGVLGSELRYEDFDPSVIRRTEVKKIKTENLNGKPHDILEARLPKGQSPYERVQIWIQNGLDLPVQIDYYSQGQKVKTLQFQGYKKVGQVLRPHKLVIRNLKNKRGTDIELSQVKINRGLNPQKLSVDSLAKAW